MKTKGIYFLYRVLQALALPAILLYFVSRGLKQRGYWHSLPQRFGFLPRSFRQTGPGAIWLHAVSVGEVLACVELLRRLRGALPHTRLLVSTSTLAGRETAGQKLGGLADGIFFAPVDYVFAVRRVLRALRPSVVVVAETEIWPNLFREVKRTGAGLALVNGRISDRALPRYLPFRWFFRAVLPQMDSILVQTEAVAERFVALGAPAGRVKASGNFKYDFEARAAAAESPVVAFLEQRGSGKIWIAASTMPPAEPGDVDEDDAVIAAFRELSGRHAELMLLLAPRKPERFDAAARKLEAAGIRYARRSALPGKWNGERALLLDTIGELNGLFCVADAVFMGGTLAHRGGHNILEPAFFAKPVIVGPHMENFQAIADEFRAADACAEIWEASDLAGAVEALLSDENLAREMGARALACTERQRGATGRAAAVIRELHAADLPRHIPPMPWRPVAWALSRVWLRVARQRQAAKLRAQRKVDAPVVSVGNLSMGGTGKTPCVLRIAELLKERGHRPAILTRGYKRGSPQKLLVLAPGAVVNPMLTGDEPQIFVRSGVAPVGIGGDRYRTAMLLRREFDVDVMLLDDGFQHVQLARNMDVVLIDGLNPFGGGEVFPLGRLREPVEGVARADAIVITRAESSDLAPAIERRVRKWNARAPIFQAYVTPTEWVENRTGARHSPTERPFERAGVFCGLGNPQSFRRTLEALGIEPVDWIDFDDHHRYRPKELEHLVHQFQAKGATALVTTEKDAMNLCQDCDDLLAPLPLFWLRVGMRFEHAGEFLDAIEQRLE